MVLFRSYRTKLQAALLLLGLTALGIAGWQASEAAAESLRTATFERLTAIRETRARQIERYFLDLGNHLLALSADEATVSAVEQFTTARSGLPAVSSAELRKRYDAIFQELHAREPDVRPRVAEWFPEDPFTLALQHWFIAQNPFPAGSRFKMLTAPGAGAYSEIHARYHPTLQRYLSALGFYDIFLIGPDEGRVLYSVMKEVDLGAKLTDPPYNESKLAEVWRRAMKVPEPETFVIEDFAPYLPSGLAPAAFAAAPVYRAGRAIGVLAIQISIDEVNRIMTGERLWAEEGLGRTGQAYLIGDNGTLRSDIRQELEHSEQFFDALRTTGIHPNVIDRIRRYGTAVLNLRVSHGTPQRTTGLAEDFRGVRVLRSAAPLSIAGLKWKVVAEIEADEALAPVAALRKRMLWQAALLGFALVVAAHFLGAGVTRPVLRLADSARRLGQRDFGVRLPVDSSDELGQLAASFNRMAEDLERTTVSKQELDRLLSSLINAVFVIAAPGRPGVEEVLAGPLRQVNRAGLELLHREPGEACLSDLLPPEDMNTWRERLARLIEEGRLPATEATLLAHNGTPVPVLFSASRLAEEEGQSPGMVCVAQDISEWKITQDKLRRMSKVFMDASDPMVVADAQGRIADCNMEAEQSYGWTLQELEGQDLSRLFKDTREFAKLLERCLRGETLRNLETIQLNRNGHEFPALVTLSLLTGEDAGIAGVAAISKDITELKLAAEFIRQKQAELEKLTGRLITAQEEERAHLARELHDNMSQRLAAVAIEAGRLERIPADDPRWRTIVDRIKKEMVAVSTEVHGLSRRLHPSTLADLGLVAAIESECRAFFERTGVPVELSASEDLPELHADTKLGLYRIVQEALWNIFKHADATEVAIGLHPQNGLLRLSIEDNGLGFDRNAEDWHAGVGIASMAERTRLMGGTFAVHSAPGQGTHIEVCVPEEKRMHKPKVLLADDHKIVLEGLRGVLEEDFELIAYVTNGRDLVEEAIRLQPDVVVVDISMPLLNGIDAVSKLRALGSTAKVVFLTMHPDSTYATRALQAGGSAYVVKHSASDELVTAINAVLLGSTYISPVLKSPALEDLFEESRQHRKQTLELTARQREVLQLLAEGKSAKEIGTLLDISSRTVEAHKYRMMDEIGVKTSAQLVQYAIRHGIVAV